MAYGLTPRMAQCLAAIQAFVAGGTSPSYRELGGALGISSKNSVHRLVSGLQERGYIRKMAGRQRSIELLGGAHVEPRFAMCADLDGRLGQ